MAIRLIDRKRRQVVTLPDSEALTNLNLEPSNWLPLKGEDYFVESEDGKILKVDGSRLNQVIGDSGGKLLTSDEANIKLAVQAEYSAVGQALKSAGSESLLLGLNKNRALPEDPVSRQIELERRKRFGMAEGVGSAVGMIAPVLAGGVGGIVSAGAKAGAKKVLGTGLKQAGKAPSALVFKAASKVGEKVAKKTGNKLVGGVAGGAVFAGAEAGIQGTKIALQTKRENESKEVQQAWDSVLGKGVKQAGETFIATSGWMAAFGAVGKTAGLAFKGAGKIGKALGVTPEGGLKASRHKFYGVEPGARGRKQMEILKRPFGGNKVTKEETLDNFEMFLRERKILTPQSKNKEQVLATIVNQKDKVGKLIKQERDKMTEIMNKNTSLSGRKLFFDTVNEDLEDIVKSYSKVQKEGLYRPLITDIKKVQGIIQRDIKDLTKGRTKNLFNFRNFKDTMDLLSRKADWNKREASVLKIHKGYRKAYYKLTNLENELYEKAFTSNIEKLKNLLPDFGLHKKQFSKLQASQDVLDKALPTGTNFLSNFRLLDLKHSLGGIIGGTIGWSAGGPVGGGIGAAAGGLASLQLSKLQQEGWTYLQVAKRLERANKWMDKNKSVSGVKWLLSNPEKEFKMNTNSISTMLLGRGIPRLEDIEEQIAVTPSYKLAGMGNDNLFRGIEDFGGRDNAVNFTAKMAALKRDIVSLMPASVYDQRDNKSIPKLDREKFIELINQGVTPMDFVNAIVNKKLTAQGYELFSRNYSFWLSKFNANFMQGVKRGLIKENFYYSFLKNRNTTAKDFIYSSLDREQAQRQNQQVPKRMLRKNQPSVSEAVQGGY